MSCASNDLNKNLEKILRLSSPTSYRHRVRLVYQPPALQYFPLTPLQHQPLATSQAIVFFSHTTPAPACRTELESLLKYPPQKSTQKFLHKTIQNPSKNSKRKRRNLPPSLGPPAAHLPPSLLSGPAACPLLRPARCGPPLLLPSPASPTTPMRSGPRLPPAHLCAPARITAAWPTRQPLPLPLTPRARMSPLSPSLLSSTSVRWNGQSSAAPRCPVPQPLSPRFPSP